MGEVWLGLICASFGLSAVGLVTGSVEIGLAAFAVAIASLALAPLVGVG